VQMRDGSHRDLHNVYGMLMAKSTYEGLRKLQENQRPFVLTRAGYAGVQKYAWMWTGDNRSRWEDLNLCIPMCLGMGLSGVAGCGVDIGGFAGTPTPELYARFIELGAFLPLCRTHTMEKTPDQEPWSYGKEVEDISRKYIELRYRLLPYWYTYTWQASQTGVPIVRTMWMEYPSDTTCYIQKWEDTQFLVGPHLLVAPVTVQSATSREVYLPAGSKWVDFYQPEKIFEGGQIINVQAPLNHLPLFVAENTVLPMFKRACENVEETAKSGLEFVCFGKNKTDCKGLLYVDDAFSRKFEHGECGLYSIDHTGKTNLLFGNGYN